jgi:hypothetical protein
LPVPASLVVGMGLRVGAWGEELVVEVAVDMLRLEIHQHMHRRHG